MDLALKFKVVSAINSITKPPCVEADKTYPIMEISKSTFLEGLFIIMMKIQLNADGKQCTYVLSPVYCVVVSGNDISKINAEPGKFN
jgi:hypothetical protein